jgi:hypothetical protein
MIGLMLEAEGWSKSGGDAGGWMEREGEKRREGNLK